MGLLESQADERCHIMKLVSDQQIARLPGGIQHLRNADVRVLVLLGVLVCGLIDL